MVFSVHLERSTVRAIMNCSIRGQFNAFDSLRPVALQWICLIQESPTRHGGIVPLVQGELIPDGPEVASV
jgi:hypothetical protein